MGLLTAREVYTEEAFKTEGGFHLNLKKEFFRLRFGNVDTYVQT